MSRGTAERATSRSRHVPKHAPRRVSAGSKAAGAVGEILITLGVLVGLFVVWQVWWTDVVAGRAASQHLDAWEAGQPAGPETPVEPRYDGVPEEPSVANGLQFAALYVPAWGADWQFPVAAGVDYASVLDNGFVGHFPETALPGQVGNFALAGHRQSYGRPFYSLPDLQQGDAIIVRTSQNWYVYRVSGSEVIRPTDVDVLAPVPRQPGVDPTTETITLITCHPLWSVAQRYVVYGELDYWAPVSEGRPADLPRAGGS